MQCDMFYIIIQGVAEKVRIRIFDDVKVDWSVVIYVHNNITAPSYTTCYAKHSPQINSSSRFIAKFNLVHT